MCGIVGIVRADGRPVDQRLLLSMRDSIAHRGPDDEGIYLGDGVGLGHRRLAILDLTSAGHQPMGNEDGTLWVVYNGEIYNYVELAQELMGLGYNLVSKSDTEVLLRLYEQYGKACLHKLNGMFAFAIWNTRDQSLFAARDRLGIKPFYYHHAPDWLSFASEVKALLEDDSIPRCPNYEAIADYLFAGAPLGRKTAIAGVRQLEPGEWLTWHRGQIKVGRYWELAYNYNSAWTAPDLVETLTRLADDAVRVHSRSDAPLGCHLSGGLDSSTVVGLASRYVRSLRTFSIRFEGGSSYDETPHAKAVAAYVGATYLEDSVPASDLATLLPALIYHMDAPLPNPGGFCYFSVSNLARRHVKVSLTGHGGDEVFAGYPSQFKATFGSMEMFDLSAAPSEELPAGQRVRTVWRREGLAGVLSRCVRRIRQKRLSFEDLWISLHCAGEPAHHPMVDPRFLHALGGYTPRDDYICPLQEAPTDELLDKCLYHDLRSYLPTLLQMEDRASMAVSLESRVPLLDHRLVEMMATVPPALKVWGRQPKHLLREIAASVIPETVRTRRDKSSFPVPLGPWFAGRLAGMVRSILRSPQCLDRGIFNPDRLREDGLSPATMWQVLNVELWFRIFIDRDRIWLERALALQRDALSRRTARSSEVVKA